MKNIVLSLCLVIILIGVGGCATVQKKPEIVEAPASKEKQIEAQQAVQLPKMKKYKRKIVIGRFSNETNYGRTLLTDDDYNRIGKQAGDMLASRLIKSGRFLVFERPDLKKVEVEQGITGQKDLIGADTVIIGSVTEFGRRVTGKEGFLSNTKRQTAYAKVDARLVDAQTGQAFFSVTGAGEASTESGEVAGFGSKADYDATLNDRAISAAISNMINNLIVSLEARSWKTDILDIQNNQVFISGGKSQGIKVGDRLAVMKKTKSVKSKQSGFMIDLPPKKIATVKVISLFGETETNEGTVAEVLDGSVLPANIDQLFVKEEDDE